MSVKRSASAGALDCDPGVFRCYKDASRFVTRSVTLTMKRDAQGTAQIYFCGDDRRRLEKCAEALQKLHPEYAAIIHVEASTEGRG